MAFKGEWQIVREWLDPLLRGDATLNTTLGLGGRIFHIQPGQGVTFPYLTYSDVGGVALMPMGYQAPVAKREGHLYLVAIDQSNRSDRVDQILNRARQLLHGAETTTPDGYVTTWISDELAPIAQVNPLEGGVVTYQSSEFFGYLVEPAA